MQLIDGHLQHYAWGSHDVLAGLTGRPAPTELPEAELWFGAHEAAPSVLVDGPETTLDRVVAGDPRGVLGARCASRFDDRLPFLLKVLAPTSALSIQAHPTAEEAHSAEPGTYVDGWPKPEALCPLTEFEIFAGLRPFAETAALVERLAVPALAAHVVASGLAANPECELLSRLLRVPQHEHAALADPLVAACRAMPEDDPDAPLIDAVLRVAKQHPGDIGLVVLLSMHHLVLQPGEYAFVAAGVLHSYVRGVAVEILANSDNVVRAGLTPKPIDVEELLRIVDAGADLAPHAGEPEGAWTTFPADTPFFRLRTMRPTVGSDPAPVPGNGAARILLVTEGSVHLTRGDQRVTVTSGRGCFLSAEDADVVVRAEADAQVFLASPG